MKPTPYLMPGETLNFLPAIAADLEPLRSVSPAAKRMITMNRWRQATEVVRRERDLERNERIRTAAADTVQTGE